MVGVHNLLSGLDPENCSAPPTHSVRGPHTANAAPSLDELLTFLSGCLNSAPLFAATSVIAGHRLSIECDDQLLVREFFTMFGGAGQAPGVFDTSSAIHLNVRAGIRSDFGWFRMSGRNELPIDGHEFSFAVKLDQGTFQTLATNELGWNCFAFRGATTPAFAFRGADCLFALDSTWRRGIIWYLFWRLLRIRSDVIFFHASALGILGEGTIFVGPSGAGKSTTALSLAARGHAFLGDEVAGYVPDRNELIPFLRPVGIKPGPRAMAVAAALPTSLAERIAREGFARIPIENLFPVETANSLPLRRIVFLRGFSARPLLERISPGRAEIAELQPLMSSFLNAPHSRRIFELTKLLSGAKVYQLHPGDPDETADYLEQAFASE